MSEWTMGKVLRKAGLVGLIVFDLAALGWSYYLGKTMVEIWPWVWFWFAVALNVTVIGGEIVSIIMTGKTLSTNFKYWATKEGWKAYLFLFFFTMAILSLVVHLVPTG